MVSVKEKRFLISIHFQGELSASYSTNCFDSLISDPLPTVVDSHVQYSGQPSVMSGKQN